MDNNNNDNFTESGGKVPLHYSTFVECFVGHLLTKTIITNQ